jgi:hypothetical protein
MAEKEPDQVTLFRLPEAPELGIQVAEVRQRGDDAGRTRSGGCLSQVQTALT